MMVDHIVQGSCDTFHIPNQSIGITFYNELKRKNHEKIALIDNEEISYGKLCKTSINLASQLIKLGLKKGDVVSIVSQNNWKYLAATISGFYIGAKINFLNHDYTSGELKHFFTICPPNLIFCSKKSCNNILFLRNEGLLPEHIILFDEDETEYLTFDELVKIDSDFYPVEVQPETDIAIIPTSSGTTGLPKCVLLTHANLRVPLIHFGDRNFLDFKEDDVTIGNLPFFHIWGNMIALTSVFYGIKLIIIPKFRPEVYLKTIEDYKIETLFTVPPLLIFLAKSPLVSFYDISSVKDVICAAAVITKELEEMVKDRLGLKAVRQLYGMTEASLGITMSPTKSEKVASVGKVLPTNKIKVCDIETQEALGPHKIGELRAKGGGLMVGYLSNKNATMEAFDNEGYLRTGDLGYYDEENFFYIVDRLKDIIKFKGFQISPAELENLLIQHPAVKDAAVIGIPDEVAGEVAMAFVVKQPDKNVTEKELVCFVNENVCAQKRLYGGVRFIDEIPKTSSGKIWRLKLREIV
ncbi:uncharacterized protein LOC655287 [Tribolium castaneum]|uniref:Luciferin 4-monooxygenase n=1 Tax=Tribolium castaneum TaxID=7070 RepID=D6WTM3_TRICA|nr:PREDICTED: 4-coumarate--CoA ligase 1 [Tribolium castaneum]EFA05828.2 Luciferin 4-monooxygenase-like Protein [Tribolium castaneum]|eukprot:XP_008198171.2 PREDICTED: 4-coumarate--CoA ligase 1 [Tribolium castaneum]